MSVLTPICVPCRLEMRCVKNDRVVRDPSTDRCPSTYWLGDEYQCPACRNRIVTGFGKALASHPGAADEKEEALQFDYERSADLMLHLELKAGSGPADDVTRDIPLWFPAGMDPADIRFEPAFPIPLLAFGDVRKPIALLTVSLLHDGGLHPDGGRKIPRTLKALGAVDSPDSEGGRPLWIALAEGMARASVCLRDLRSRGKGLKLLAISLELAVAAERPAAEDQQKGGEG